MSPFSLPLFLGLSLSPANLTAGISRPKSSSTHGGESKVINNLLIN